MPVFLDFYGKNIANHSQLFPSAKDVLKQLNETGFSVALCTNKPIGLTRPLLEELGITSLFAAITGGDSFEFRKPDPRHILATADILPGNGPILMVGDSLSDINGASAANVSSIAVDFGYSIVPPAELGADKLISHLSEIPELVSLSNEKFS